LSGVEQPDSVLLHNLITLNKRFFVVFIDAMLCIVKYAESLLL